MTSILLNFLCGMIQTYFMCRRHASLSGLSTVSSIKILFSTCFNLAACESLFKRTESFQLLSNSYKTSMVFVETRKSTQRVPLLKCIFLNPLNGTLL